MTSGRRVEQVEVSEPDLDGVGALMRELVDGRGWLVLRPGVRPGDEPAPARGLLGLFGGPVHHVPVCSWVPGAAGGQELGIQHAAGVKAARRLAEGPGAVPAGWRVTQDHPRRGLVVVPPAGTEPEAALAWLVAAAHGLTRVPLTGGWLVDVHRR